MSPVVVGVSGVSASALLPVLIIVVLLASDLWLYADAKARYEQGTPVVFSTDMFVLETPTAWLLSCIVMWLVFFPLYLRLRRPPK